MFVVASSYSPWSVVVNCDVQKGEGDDEEGGRGGADGRMECALCTYIHIHPINVSLTSMTNFSSSGRRWLERDIVKGVCCLCVFLWVVKKRGERCECVKFGGEGKRMAFLMGGWSEAGSLRRLLPVLGKCMVLTLAVDWPVCLCVWGGGVVLVPQ